MVLSKWVFSVMVLVIEHMSPTEDPKRVAAEGETGLASGMRDNKGARDDGSLQMTSDLHCYYYYLCYYNSISVITIITSIISSHTFHCSMYIVS